MSEQSHITLEGGSPVDLGGPPFCVLISTIENGPVVMSRSFHEFKDALDYLYLEIHLNDPGTIYIRREDQYIVVYHKSGW